MVCKFSASAPQHEPISGKSAQAAVSGFPSRGLHRSLVTPSEILKAVVGAGI